MGATNLAGDVAVDLVVEFSDQPGIIARGRLEDARMEVVLLNPAALPAWLGRYDPAPYPPSVGRERYESAESRTFDGTRQATATKPLPP
jgi:hypothetical protein